MLTKDELARKASSLGIRLWESENSQLETAALKECNEFVNQLNSQVRDGAVSRDDAVKAMIIIQIFGFSSTKKLGRDEDIRRRLSLTRETIKKVELAENERSILLKMLDLIESSVFADTSKPNPELSAAERTVSDYILDLYDALLKRQYAK